MKKITVVCDVNGQKSPFDFYVGQPDPYSHPIRAQATWFSGHRGGTVPPEVMEALNKIYELAKKNNVDFAELCYHAVSATNNAAT